MDAGQIKATIIVEDNTKEGLDKAKKSLTSAANEMAKAGQVALSVDTARTTQNVKAAAKQIATGATIELSPTIDTKAAKSGATQAAREIQGEAGKATETMQNALKSTISYVNELLKGVNGAASNVDTRAVGRYKEAASTFIANAGQTDKADSREGYQYSKQLYGEANASLNTAQYNNTIDLKTLEEAKAKAAAVTAEAEKRLGVESDEAAKMREIVTQIDAAVSKSKQQRAAIDAARKSIQQQNKEANKAAKANNITNGNGNDTQQNTARLKEMNAQYKDMQANLAVMRADGKENTEEYKRLSEEAKKLKETITGTGKATDEALKADKPASFRTQLLRVREEMTKLQAAGKANTKEYAELSEKASELKANVRTVTSETSGTTAAQTSLAGVASAMSGAAAAGSVAAGAFALVGDESQDLQKAMVKLQAVMSITNGLQTIAATLSKTSAASIWLQQVATAAQSASTTADTAATTANTAAHAANSATVTAGTTAATAATAANATAATAGTAANIGLAGAFRMVGAAIKSIPVFGWIAAGITALIAVWHSFTSESRKLKEEQEELHKAIAAGSANSVAKLNTLRQLWAQTADQESKQNFLVRYNSQLNELGVTLKDVAEAEEYFKGGLSNTTAYAKASAAASAAADKLKEAQERLIQLEEDQKTAGNVATTRAIALNSIKTNPMLGGIAIGVDKLTGWGSETEASVNAEAIEEQKKEVERLQKAAIEAEKAKNEALKKDSTNADEIAKAKERRDALVKLQSETTDAQIAAMRDGYAKQRKELEKSLQDQKAAIQKAREDMAASQGGSLTSEQSSLYDRQVEAANKSYLLKLSEVNRQEIEEIRQRNQETKNLEWENVNARLAIMADGTAKEKAQIEAEYQQNLEQIKQEREEYKREASEKGFKVSKRRLDTYDQSEIIAAEERAKRLKELEQKTADEVDELRKKIRDEQNQSLQDGYAKELAIIRAAYQDKEDELNKLEEQWRKGDSTDGTLSTEHAEYLTSARQSNSRNLEKQENALIMSDYEKTLQQKEALTNDYNAKRIEIEKTADETIKQNRLQALEGTYHEQMKQLDDEQLDGMIKNSKTLIQIFGNVNTRSQKATKQVKTQLNQLLQRSRDKTTSVTGMTNDEADKLLENSGALQKIWEEINTLQDASDSDTGFLGALKKMGTSLAGVVSSTKALKTATDQADIANLMQQQENALLSFRDAAIAAMAGFSEFANSLSSFANLVGADSEISQNLQNVGTVMSDVASYTAMGASLGGGWGALAGAVVGAASGMSKIWVSSKVIAQENAASLKEFNRQLELLELTLKDDVYESIFGTKSATKAADAYDVATKALKKYGEIAADYNDKLADTWAEAPKWLTYFDTHIAGESVRSVAMDGVAAGGDYETGFKNKSEEYRDKANSIRYNLEEANSLTALKKAADESTSSLGSMNAVQTKKAKWYKIGSVDRYNTLDQYDIWQEDGSLDVEKAQKFLDTQKNITSEAREAIENAIELNQAYEDAVAEIDSYLNSIFGNWSDDLTDVIYDSIYNGTDAWSGFQQVGEETIADLGKSLAKELIMTAYLDSFKDKLREAVGADDGGMSLQNVIGEMMGGMGTVYDQMSDFAQLWEDAAKANGYDVAKQYTNSSSSTLSGAIATASQESIDLLAGQTNAVRVQQIEGISVMRQQLEQLAGINTAATKTAGLTNNLCNIASSLLAKYNSGDSSLRASGKTSY